MQLDELLKWGQWRVWSESWVDACKYSRNVTRCFNIHRSSVNICHIFAGYVPKPKMSLGRYAGERRCLLSSIHLYAAALQTREKFANNRACQNGRGGAQLGIDQCNDDI